MPKTVLPSQSVSFILSTTLCFINKTILLYLHQVLTPVVACILSLLIQMATELILPSTYKNLKTQDLVSL